MKDNLNFLLFFVLLSSLLTTRECHLFPEKKGLKQFVTDGFKIKHAASNWVPPDLLQKGAIVTCFGYEWVIKNYRISNVKVFVDKVLTITMAQLSASIKIIMLWHRF